ncbi:MAG: hypothetical protein ACK4PN_04525 [Allorhizobium sp.]
MTQRLTSSIAAAWIAGALPAIAADCAVEQAVYAEPEAGIELRFAPSGEDTPVSHRFTLLASFAGMKVDGHVLYDPEIERPVAMALDNCPDGDVTGADIAACTVWKGIIYAADRATGIVGLLPEEGAKAPDNLILPGFGPAIAASAFGAAMKASPGDVFTFKQCSPKA